MQRQSILGLFLFLVFLASAAEAQNGGSAYSRYGIGDIRYFSSSRSIGMGGSSFALLSANSIDDANPALWARIARTQFSASALYEGFSASDSRKSGYFSNASFNGFMLAVPVVTQWGIVFAGGITPLSRINYNIPVSIADYTIRYLGDGGVSQGEIGFSAAPTSDLTLGVKLNYYFGTLHHSIDQTFPAGTSTNTELVRSTRLNGIGGSFGAVYGGLKKLFGLPETQSLNIGAVFTSTSNLTATEERYFTYTTSTLTTQDTLIAQDGKMRLPFALGGGIAFTSERFALTSGAYYQNWNSFTDNGAGSPELRDSYRISVGGELIPKRDATASFFKRLAYTAGFFYDATYYTIKNQSINEVGFSGGFGIPLFTDTHLHLAAEYGIRGTTDQNLQKDKILRISMTLNVGELWFVRPPEE